MPGWRHPPEPTWQIPHKLWLEFLASMVFFVYVGYCHEANLLPVDQVL